MPKNPVTPFGHDVDDGFSSSRKRSPNFGFSTATRFKNLRPMSSTRPGPSDYIIKPTVADGGGKVATIG